MYKLTDYVTEVLITGVDPIYDQEKAEEIAAAIGYTAGSMLVTYNNGPQSRFVLKASRASRKHYEVAVLHTARGRVLDAIEAVQRWRDGEPAWLQAAKEANKEPRFLAYL